MKSRGTRGTPAIAPRATWLSNGERRAIAEGLPDTPPWLETRAILQLPAGRAVRLGDGVLVCCQELMAVVGDPEPTLLAQHVRREPAPELMCQTEAGDRIRAALPEFERERVLLFEHTGEIRWSAEVPVTQVMSGGALQHVPPALRRNLEWAVGWTDVWGAQASDGTIAAFAYAAWSTESLYDISLDTLVEYRSRGLAHAAAAALMVAAQATGRSPVWGSPESNAPSREVAASLGFSLATEAWLFTRPARG